MAHLWQLGTIAVAALAAIPRAETRDSVNSPAVRVHVENYAAVAPSMIHGAQNQVARIYKAAGVRVTWSTRRDHADCAGTLTIHVLLLSLEMEDRISRNDGVGSMVLAQASQEGRRVHVFWSRVDAHVSRTSLPDALGVIIAHELGHVLLPTRGHASAGIMQGTYMMHSSYLQRFTSDQAAAIRAFITAHAPGQSRSGP